mmetsp:Transcript_23568/g.54832  ORF Transcript_23568/g.54832 Transcript_23568/m.54832 type:complete len:90 (+) Transcript_23568:413-682(+)
MYFQCIRPQHKQTPGLIRSCFLTARAAPQFQVLKDRNVGCSSRWKENPSPKPEQRVDTVRKNATTDSIAIGAVYNDMRTTNPGYMKKSA